MNFLLLASLGCSSHLHCLFGRYTATEVLTGENAYSCEKCKDKVKAERRLCFEVAPNVLQICLKRFVSVRAYNIHMPVLQQCWFMLVTCQHQISPSSIGLYAYMVFPKCCIEVLQG